MAPLDLKNAFLLCDAARRVYQQVLSEGLPLAHIAEQSERPQYWFANSMLHVVAVQGRRSNEEAHIVLTRGTLAALKLSDDTQVLIDPESGEAKFADLRLMPEQLERYMAWARTVY
jgi:hypothetical protein